MDPLCLIVAGAIQATLPATEFTLAWTHSVQKTRWEEHYRVAGHDLLLIEARIQGSGAGMEPPTDAKLRDGWWTWQPQLRLPELRLTRYAVGENDYSLCWQTQCRTLQVLVGAANDAATVEIRPCAALAQSESAAGSP